MKHRSFLLTGATLVLASVVATYAMSTQIYMFQALASSLPSWVIAVYAACFLALMMGVSLVAHVFLTKIDRD